MAALTGDALREAEDEFTDAFNRNRAILAGFSKCESAMDLACVRDGFHLGMAKALQLESYKAVQDHIVKDMRVAAAAAIDVDVFQTSVAVARQAPGWKAMVAEVMKKAAKTLSGPIVMQILFLSLLYFGNNQLSFFSYTLADPGTIYLFKSGSTFIVATVQTCCGVKTFSCDQWKSLALQACGMIIVQYDPCQNKGRYSVLAYSCMCFSSVITALCAVRNEHMVKNYNVGLNVQNAVLYFGGLCFNLAGFHLLPNPSSKAAVGFFEGYDSVPAVGVVFANSIVGLAISATYKYADAVVKCLASDVTSVLLIIVSVQFFDLKPNITMWCGMGVVTYAVHAYINATTQVVPLKSEKLGKGQDEEATIEMARLIQEPTSEAVPRNIGRSVPAGSNLAEAYSGADFRDRAEVHRKICSSGIELG
eukprot:TRINITY_DN34255_c0_g1_i3.p1 TRINITY_DN34255_c0_g1~~TRINITY_DN34255_c0_g1_i3.p1  ORF type:complete len:449 (-),score=88.66 TRINITY_DN34255_c0_g1_i3:63-1322(-)